MHTHFFSHPICSLLDKLEAATEEDPSKEALLQSIEVKIVDLQSQLRAVKDQRESGSIPQPTGGGVVATRGGVARGRGGRFSAPRGGGRGRFGGGYYPTHSFAPRGRGKQGEEMRRDDERGEERMRESDRLFLFLSSSQRYIRLCQLFVLIDFFR